MSADQPTAAAAVGRTREELAAASAALLGAALEVDCSDAAVFLNRRAREFDQEAMDAPPVHAVSDEALLGIISTMFLSGAASVYATSSGLPHEVVKHLASRIANRAMASPLVREELLTAARNALAGKCTCGSTDLHVAGGHVGPADSGEGS